MSENDCTHEFFDGKCIHCGAEVSKESKPINRSLNELPSQVPLTIAGKKQRSNEIPPHILAEEMREKQLRMAQSPPPPPPKPKLKEAKSIELNIPISRYSVAWSEDEKQLFLIDEVYEQNMVVVDFVGIPKGLSIDKKKEILKTIIEAI